MAKKKKSSSRSSTRTTAAEKKRKELMNKLRQFIRTEGAGYLKDPNISSIGVGHKISNGKRTKELCIQFTVNSKPEVAGTLPEGMQTNFIPESIDVDGETIPTDVLERSYEASYTIVGSESITEAVSQRKIRQDPMFPGISVCHPSGTAGTIGLIVYDVETGAPCMLSNWHVLHTPNGAIGDTVVQPGPFDDNDVSNNAAGVLIRSHLGAAGDCAIARIEDRDFTTDIFDLGKTPTQIAEVDIDDRVVKSGRTTDVTRGIVRRVDVMASINYGGHVGSEIIGGFEIEPLPGAGADHEISMGGDSGSAWMIANRNGSSTDIFAGLHFAGESPSNPDEHALACYPLSVFKKLRIALTPPSEEELLTTGGYDQDFLAERVRIPWMSEDVFDDTFKLRGSHIIHYTHFSVCQSKSRRLPRLVAWNIDGSRLKSLSRDGIDFRLDPRIPRQFQAGNELYKNNPLDRGHVARRADLTWGSMTEARKANTDSFFFTNITPQHQAFNQSSRSGLWGKLENAIMADVKVEDLKVSVLSGPIFRDNDPEHRNVKIPREFWKLVAYKDTADDQFKVRAFVLTQKNLIRNIEALELDRFRVFQVSLARLSDLTELDFDSIGEFDTFRRGREAESLTADAREIVSDEDVVA